ncbi:hypothetical protein BDB00DRAFT_850751 [Zychaea mexicana]|uniref:uncharacterized protein n=1 Tax=Zychaea mexicana TaxID=64656 RepID=UPI0022FEA4DD|nr:uncharacterized protein BDB00DRAFT_850751 [Zychaea mexicana]KAI9487950.1 hypothetical protein BDB00DRAFT_850751 [Zychaea mexicana]
MCCHDGHVKHTEANGIPAENGQPKLSSSLGYGFVSRVTSYPIVQDGFSTVKAYAGKSKVATFAIDKANNTLSTVSSYQPKYVQTYYETYVQPHVQRADDLGCKSLDLIQNHFPVVNQPTAEIVSAVKAPPRDIITGVRQRLTTPAQAAARAANDRITTVVDTMEHTIDRYLPAPQNTKRKSFDKNNTTTANASHAVRVYQLLHEASSRVGQLVIENTPRSRDDLANLSIVQTATNQLQFIQETLRHSITVYSQAAQQRVPAAVTERFHQLHGTLTSQLNQLAGFVKTRTELPDWLKSRLQTLADTATAQYSFAKKEYARSDITTYDKAKNVTQNLQAQLLPLLQNVHLQVRGYAESARQKAEKDLGPYVPFGNNKIAASTDDATTASQQ